jgi:nitrogen regulatory protein PII
MFLVVFVLHDPDKLDDLLTAWEATGVSGVTILPSSGLGRMRQADAMRDDLPMMPSLDDFLGREPHLSRTLFSLVDAQAGVDALIAATREVVGDLNQPQTGLLFVLPVSQAEGLRKHRPDSV